jgi:hypothetical protein
MPQLEALKVATALAVAYFKRAHNSYRTESELILLNNA